MLFDPSQPCNMYADAKRIGGHDIATGQQMFESHMNNFDTNEDQTQEYICLLYPEIHLDNEHYPSLPSNSQEPATFGENHNDPINSLL